MTPASLSPPAAPGAAAFLDAAHRIGERLLAGAAPSGRGCTWTVSATEYAAGQRTSVARPAGPGLYAGTAGIGLFLAELFAATGDSRLVPALTGALEHALDAEAAGRAGFGFHVGSVGVAYAAVRAGELLGDATYHRRAAALLAPLRGREQSDALLDAIGGAAGAVPALLRMAGHLDRDLTEGMARALGDHILATAEREPSGWSWSTSRPSASRNLCGYAHGNSGFFHALVELFAATGDGAYRYGAEQAWLYERQFFDPAQGNWPDLRHSELGALYHSGRVGELRARLRGGGHFPAYTRRFMSAWCHGAPGIGLARLRAWSLLGEPEYRVDAEAAIRSTRATFGAPPTNHSLCHGRFGDAETLLLGAEVLGDPELRDFVVADAARALEGREARGLPWISGTPDNAPDPTLLLGEAGIGLFFLRLHDPSVPSVLLVAPHTAGATPRPGHEAGWRAARAQTVHRHFGRTLQVMSALGAEPAGTLPAGDPCGPPRVPDAEAACAAITARIAAEPDAARAGLLRDAAGPEAERFALYRARTDRTAEYLHRLARPGAEEVRWDVARLRPAAHTRRFVSHWDWDAWLQGGGCGAPTPADITFLAHAEETGVTLRRLSPLAALVLRALEGGATRAEVVARLRSELAADEPPERQRVLEERVAEQVVQLYRSGFIDAVP